MKTYNVRLAGLALFFATGMVFGMEQGAKVYLKNDLTAGSTGEYQIGAEINEKSEIKVNQGETKLLGSLSSINKLLIRRTGFLSGKSSGLTVRSADDLTNQIKKASSESNQNRGRVLLITVTWKYPGSYTSYEWNYTFNWINPNELLKQKETPYFGMSDTLKNLMEKPDESTANIIKQIWTGDITKDKRFQKQLEEYAHAYTTKPIATEVFKNNITTLLNELKRLRTLDVKTPKLKVG